MRITMRKLCQTPLPSHSCMCSAAPGGWPLHNDSGYMLIILDDAAVLSSDTQRQVRASSSTPPARLRTARAGPERRQILIWSHTRTGLFGPGSICGLDNELSDKVQTIDWLPLSCCGFFPPLTDRRCCMARASDYRGSHLDSNTS